MNRTQAPIAIASPTTNWEKSRNIHNSNPRKLRLQCLWSLVNLFSSSKAKTWCYSLRWSSLFFLQALAWRRVFLFLVAWSYSLANPSGFSYDMDCGASGNGLSSGVVGQIWSFYPFTVFCIQLLYTMDCRPFYLTISNSLELFDINTKYPISWAKGFSKVSHGHGVIIASFGLIATGLYFGGGRQWRRMWAAMRRSVSIITWKYFSAVSRNKIQAQFYIHG